MAKDFNISSKVLDTDKYVYREERDLAKTQVDWGTISKNLTETINTVRDERETQKAEIEKAQTEAMNRAGEFDQYNNKSLNVSVLEGSEWAKNALSTQFDLVRRGLITPAEYKRYEQRTMDSFSSLKGNLDKFAAHYDEAAQRESEGIANINEQFTNDSLAGLANLSQYELQGNAATGELYYLKTGTNPATGEPYDPNDPANQISLSVINSRVNQKQDFVKTSDAAQLEVDKLGEVVDATILANQGVKTMEDWRQLEGSEEMMDGMVTAICGQPSQIINVLQDRLGYTVEDMTQDPAVAAANPDMILMIPDPDGSGRLVPDFTSENGKKLKAKAEEAARLAIEAQISQKAGFTKGFDEKAPTSTDVGVADRERKARGFYGEVVDLVTGDAADAEAASTALASIVNANLGEGDSPITNITRSADGQTFTIERRDGGSFEISAITSEGDTKSTNQIVDELFQEVNPYGPGSKTEIDLVLARDAYGETIPDTIGEGAATGTVRREALPELDFQAGITIDDEKVGALTHLENVIGADEYDDWRNAPGEVTEQAFNDVVSELIREIPELKNSGYEIQATKAGNTQILEYMDESTTPPTPKKKEIDGGFIRFYFPGLPDTGYGNGVRVIEDINDKSVAETYQTLQKIMTDWRNVTNQAGGKFSRY